MKLSLVEIFEWKKGEMDLRADVEVKEPSLSDESSRRKGGFESCGLMNELSRVIV
jgi:hypothetical protein